MKSFNLSLSALILLAIASCAGEDITSKRSGSKTEPSIGKQLALAADAAKPAAAEMCKAWPPHPGDGAGYNNCPVPDGAVTLSCHAHVCKEGEVFPGGGPELHCVETGAGAMVPPRVFGASIDFEKLCAPPAAMPPTTAISPMGTTPTTMHLLEEDDVPASDFALADAPIKNPIITIKYPGGTCPCCAAPKTGEDPRTIDCKLTPDKCATFMLCAAANPLALLDDAAKKILCDMYLATKGKEGPFSHECRWGEQRFCDKGRGLEPVKPDDPCLTLPPILKKKDPLVIDATIIK